MTAPFIRSHTHNSVQNLCQLYVKNPQESMGIGRHGVCGASALSHVEGVPYNGVANVQTHHLNTEGAIAWEMLSNRNRVTQIPVQLTAIGHLGVHGETVHLTAGKVNNGAAGNVTTPNLNTMGRTARVTRGNARSASGVHFKRNLHFGLHGPRAL